MLRTDRKQKKNMQKIFIKNNGPIKEFEMEIRDVNLLIGEQSSGKSTIAKSIFFFRNLKTLLTNFLIQIAETGLYNGHNVKGKKFYKLLGEETKTVFIKLFGYSWDLNPDFYMRYDFTKEIFLTVNLGTWIRNEKKYICLQYSPELTKKIQELTEESFTFHNAQKTGSLNLALEQEMRNRNRAFIMNRISEVFEDDFATYYIPAGRSLLTVMSASRGVMNQAQNLDLITDQFMGLIDSIRGSFMEGINGAYRFYPSAKRPFDVHQLSKKIIEMQKGEYFATKNGEELRLAASSIKINFMSSGQQELLWLINFLYVLILRQEKAFVIVEEPEAHIYPTLQNEIVNFLISYVNLCSGRLFCTTHSPYVLSSINNSFYAGYIFSKGEKYVKQVKDIIPQSSIIKNNCLSAIKLYSGNTKEKQFESLVEKNEGEIKSEMIDEVSDKINEIYTKLYSVLLDNEDDE